MNFNTFRSYPFTGEYYTNEGTKDAPVWAYRGTINFEVNDAGGGGQIQLLIDKQLSKGDRIDNISDSKGTVMYSISTAETSTHLVTGIQNFVNPFGAIEYVAYRLTQTA